MSLLFAGIAFAAGFFGAFVGGTGMFVLTGVCGLVLAFISLNGGADGSTYSFINTYINNCALVPAISFNGVATATAWVATKRDDIKGYETGRPLGFTKDIRVCLVSGLASVFFYVLFSLVNGAFAGKIDTGAVVVIIGGTLGRIIFGKSKFYNPTVANELSPKAKQGMFITQLGVSIVAGLITCFLVKATHITSIGFSISAITLFIGFFWPPFPATHQTTMVAGYAFAASGNILIAVLFGVIAEFIFSGFTLYYNTDCNTHIDGPAVAIAICSLVIYLIFGTL